VLVRIAEKILDRTIDIMAVLSGLLLTAVMLATVFKVGLRGIAGKGIIGIDQLSGTALVYMTFLGGVWVLRKNGHVVVDLVLIGVRTSVKRGLLILNSLVGAAVCLSVSYFGFIAVQVSISRGVMVATELEIPRAIGLIPIPLGTFLLGIEFLRRAVVAYRGGLDSSEEFGIET